MSNSTVNQTPQGSKRIIDLTGHTYGHLTVLNAAEDRDKWGRMRWDCVCKCGSNTTVDSGHLRAGHTTSCGCQHSRNTGTFTYTIHGMSGTRIWRIWNAMNQRCTDPKAINFERYGGRGITVCPEWCTSFQSFYDDMFPGYKDTLTLDRIDNSGPYCKWNCKWSTYTEQANNARSNHHVEFNGVTKTVAQWSRATGIKYGTLLARLNVSGWSVERALTTMP